MSSIDTLFARLRSENRKALMPFITAGDPDLDFTASLLRELIARGAQLCEVGVPYSDPIADGPVIQASYSRALEKGCALSDILQTLSTVTAEVTAPLVTMVSYAIIYRRGLEQYVADAKAAGIAGAIVPDLPADESQRLANICQREDFSLIQLVTPTTPRPRAVQIAATSTGFLYYVSVAGITGERRELPPDLVDNVGWLRTQTDLPICIGFGISTPEHVRQLAPVADGLIVGSAFVRKVALAESEGRDKVRREKVPRKKVLSDVGQYAADLLAALDE